MLLTLLSPWALFIFYFLRIFSKLFDWTNLSFMEESRDSDSSAPSKSIIFCSSPIPTPKVWLLCTGIKGSSKGTELFSLDGMTTVN